MGCVWWMNEWSRIVFFLPSWAELMKTVLWTLSLFPTPSILSTSPRKDSLYITQSTVAAPLRLGCQRYWRGWVGSG